MLCRVGSLDACRRGGHVMIAAPSTTIATWSSQGPVRHSARAGVCVQQHLWLRWRRVLRGSRRSPSGSRYIEAQRRKDAKLRWALGKCYRIVASLCRFLLRRLTTSTKIKQKWHPNRPPMGPIWSRGGGKGYPKINKNMKQIKRFKREELR